MSATIKMPQSFNWPAIRVTGRVLFKQPALALPHVEVNNIADLDFRKLKSLGCRGVVFDKDNTLTAPYIDEVEPSLADALNEARDAFGGNVAVLSNSAGTPDDPGHLAAERVEKALGVPVLRRPEKKPRGFEAVRTHFGDDTDPSSLVMVGDRYLTDVTFGNLHGMLCVRTQLITRRGDNPVASVMRGVETGLVSVFRRLLRVQPMSHRLAAAARTCVRVPRLGSSSSSSGSSSSAAAASSSGGRGGEPSMMAADGEEAPAAAGSSSSAGARMLSMQRWAVVGDSLHPRKPARAVAEKLEAAGKEVIRINPKDRTGTLAKSFEEAGGSGESIDVIDLIINPKDGLVLMSEAASLGVKRVFVQPGAGSADIEALCEAEGIELHYGCVLREL